MHRVFEIRVFKFITLTILSIVSISNISITFAKEVELPNCVYIASYATGYEWQDGITLGLKKVLKKKCKISIFYMDSKQLHGTKQLTSVGLKAKEFIDSKNADILIFSDDNAVKYVLEPFYKHSKIPVVFCGVNETGKNYKLPYRNSTGMIEKDGFPQIFEKLFSLMPGHSNYAYLTAFGTSTQKDILSFNKTSAEYGLKSRVVKSYSELEWRDNFLSLNQDEDIDFIILDSNKPFESWDVKKNLQLIKNNQTKILIAIQSWMLPYTTIGVIKSPEEQGRWAGLVVLEIFKGIEPQKIPVVPNKEFNYWYNPEQLKFFPQIVNQDEFQETHEVNE